MTDYSEQLISINSAIAAIESGAQEYRIGSHTVRRADLATLYAERRHLETMVSAENTYGTTTARLMRR